MKPAVFASESPRHLLYRNWQYPTICQCSIVCARQVFSISERFRWCSLFPYHCSARKLILKSRQYVASVCVQVDWSNLTTVETRCGTHRGGPALLPEKLVWQGRYKKEAWHGGVVKAVLTALMSFYKEQPLPMLNFGIFLNVAFKGNETDKVKYL